MMRPPPSGHMVINMKTTITTHGAHNGMIVQAGVQSGAASSHNTQWYVPSRFPQIQTPTIIGPQAIVPHASHENLATSWPSLQIAANSPVPEQSRLKQRNAFLPENSPNLHAQQQQQHQEQQQRHRPPLPTGTQSTSPSPIFPFNRQDSSPEEFIEPTKITLNVFNPGRSDPLCFETNLQRSTMENADALINDTVTTTTTVEVFRTALDAEKPERLVTLPPPPVPSIVDRPQLVRLNGPDHETWTSRRTETLINDRPIQTAHQGKAVQWKGTLVDEKKGAQKITAYNPYSGLRSPYENAITSRQPLVIRRQIQPGNVDPSDEGLLSRHNSYESAYLVYSPSEFPVVSHPVITRSQENLSRSPYQADLKMAKESALLTDSHDLACHPAIPDTSVNYVNRLETPILNKATSSGYEQVRRTVSAYNPGRYLDSGSLKHCSSEAHGILPDQTTAHPIRHHSRRPRSSSRGRRHRDNPLQRNCDNEQQKHCVGNANRSESPFHQKSVECATTNCYTTAPSDSLFLAYSKRPDPNLLPGEVPLRAKSQEIFNLYQTRDIMQNVVAQFGKLGYDYRDDAIPSPSTESEYSVISELSTRADRTRSDTLEEFLEDGNSVEEAYLRPLHRNNYSIMSENLYEELEHIYEELDNYYSKNLQTPERTTSASTLREIDCSEESDYAIIDFQETTRDNSDQMYKNDKSEYNDVVQRLRQEVRPYSIRKSRRIRKAHPDGLVFPKITAIVSTLPEVPEEFELLPQAPEGGGISLSSLPYVDESPQIPDNKPLPTVLMLPKEES